MAVIPQGVSNLVERVVSYLYVILTILIVIKVFQLLYSIGGASGVFKRRSKPPGEDDDESKSKKKSPKGNDEYSSSSKPKKSKSSYTYLDPTRLGEVVFKVEDVEGRPIRNAQVIIAPNRTKRKFSEPPTINTVVPPPPDNSSGAS